MTYLTVDGTMLHYQVLNATGSADGPCQIFLHGLVMDNLSSWFFTMANAASQLAKAVLYDLRGHGFSQRPKLGYSVQDHVRDLKGLVDAVCGGQAVVLVGNSYGGLIALNFAALYPELVSGLILVDAQINDLPWQQTMLSSLGQTGAGQQRMIEDKFQHWLGRSSKRKSEKLAQNARELIYETSLLDDLRAAELITDAELRQITAPCLAIYGGNSDILAVAHRLALVLPSCDLKTLPGCSHSVLWEETDQVRGLILAELERLQTACRERGAWAEPRRYGGR